MNGFAIKTITLITALLFTCVAIAAHAEQPTKTERKQVILETLDQLEALGYLTIESSNKAKVELFSLENQIESTNVTHTKQDIVRHDDNIIMTDTSLSDVALNTATASKEKEFSDYLTTINILKFLAIVAMLFMFHKIIFKIIIVIALIPQIILQIISFSIAYYIIFHPEAIWVSQAYYISIFGVVLNTFILTWFLSSHQEFLIKVIHKVFSIKTPEIDFLYFALLTSYFGFFTIHLESQLLGIFTLITFVFIFGSSFCRLINLNEKYHIDTVLAANGALVLCYSIIQITRIEINNLSYFAIGIEYVSTSVLALTLLIYSTFSTTRAKRHQLAIIALITLEILSLTAILIFHIPVIPVIINTAFFAFFLFWLFELTAEKSYILMALLMGLFLYGCAILIESHPQLFITSFFNS